MTTVPQTPDPAGGTALLVYAIVPADVEPKAEGVGRNPRPIKAVRHGEIAALVSEIDVDRPLDRIEDVQHYARALDQMAAETPIIPLRFGGAMTDADAVESELLTPNAQRFSAALDELKGHAEFILKGTYREDVVLREILDENPDAAQLRELVRSEPEATVRDASIQLGGIIATAMQAKRNADSDAAVDALGETVGQMAARPITGDNDAVDLALLVDLTRQADTLAVAEDLANRWRDRIDLSLVGPLAPWDFVTVDAT